jgi:hypothetical protein
MFSSMSRLTMPILQPCRVSIGNEKVTKVDSVKMRVRMRLPLRLSLL